MELPFKVIDYPNCIQPVSVSKTTQEEVDTQMKELSEWMAKFDVEIICARSLIK